MSNEIPTLSIHVPSYLSAELKRKAQSHTRSVWVCVFRARARAHRRSAVVRARREEGTTSSAGYLRQLSGLSLMTPRLIAFGSRPLPLSVAAIAIGLQLSCLLL